MNEVVETGERIAKGWLNGTTRGQAYLIMGLTAAGGAVVGTLGTVAVIRRKYVLLKKTIENGETVITIPDEMIGSGESGIRTGRADER